MLFSVKTTCGLKMNFKVLPGFQSILYYGFYFYLEQQKLYQFFPALKPGGKQKAYEKVEREI